MVPKAFEYAVVNNVTEGVRLLSQYAEDAYVLAGGQSLIPFMKLRLASPRVLVDISRIPGLSYIKREKDSLKIGALTTHAQIEASPEVLSLFPIMHDAAGVIGDPQVRNFGTLGGALANADPAGDWGPVMLALNAQFTCQGPDGERTIPARDFFLDAYTTRLRPDDILKEISIPICPEGSAGTFLKFVRRTGDFALVSAAVQLTMDSKGTCKGVDIGLGGVGSMPLGARQAEQTLKGTKLSLEVVDKAAREISTTVEPVSDVKGSSDYRRKVIAVIFKRAIEIARRKLQGEVLNGGYA